MSAISLQTTEEKFIISIDKNLIDKDLLMQWLDQLRVEELSQKAEFSEEIEQIGEEIKSDWWAKNKERLLSREA